MKRHDGVAPVVGSAKELRQLGLRQLLADRGNLRRGLVERLFALFVFGDVEEKTRLFQVGAVLGPRLDGALERRLLFKNRLGFLGVVPKIGLGSELV
jgi:hypothetical protein